ncbi:MAG: site-specific DNA-methyltransferase [Deinococcota bacterium]
MPTLDWIGKKAVLNHHNEIPYRTLRCDPTLSIGDAASGNLLVHADNLQALRALLPYYGGQVQLVYIDPPYNTGEEKWIYNDAVNSPEVAAWLGKVVGSEAQDLSRHDKWLCFMYPRLQLLKRFLKPEGALFVSIDDNESAHLRLLLDEIFGARNFVADFIWRKVDSPNLTA